MAGPEIDTPHALKAEVSIGPSEFEAAPESEEEAAARIDREKAIQLRADQDAAVNAEELIFASRLTSSNLMAYALNQSEAVRKQVAEKLLATMNVRLPSMTANELSEWLVSILPDASAEAHTATFMFLRDENETMRKQLAHAQAVANQAVEEKKQLLHEFRAARADAKRDFAHDDEVTAVIDNYFVGIEDRVSVPLVIESDETEDDSHPESLPIDTARVTQLLGANAVLWLYRKAKEFATGEIKKSA